jgi:ankyrin repeat protein
VFARLRERKIERREREIEIEKRKEIGQQLHKALRESPPSLEKIRSLVETCRDVLSFAEVDGNLPLHFACIYGSPLDLVRYLVEEYPDSLQVAANDGYLPLHDACLSGAPMDVVQYLAKACPKSLQVTSRSGKKPIDLAKNHEVVIWMESAMLAGGFAFDQLPLHHACIIGAPLELVRYLVEEYPDSLQVADNDGYLPLHDACLCGAPMDVVQYLAKACPKSLQVTSRSGKKPIDLAKNHEVVAWMESAMLAGGFAFDHLSSPQPSVQPVSSPFSPDRETLVQRIDIDHPISSQDIDRSISSQQPLLHPANSSFDQTTPGQTPSLAKDTEGEKRKAIGQQLHKALRELPPSLDKIQTLVEAGRGALSVADVNGNLALHHACLYGAPLEFVRYLVQEYPKSLQVTNNYGQLPLHYACLCGAPMEVVQYLVKARPKSLQVTNSSGKKPIDLTKNHEVVAWMESAMAGGVDFKPFSSPQPSVQPTDLPFSPDRETLVQRIDIDHPISSQQLLLHPAFSSFDQTKPGQTPSLTASLSAIAALSSDDNTKITQSHMNTNKETEGADFAADFKRFYEEVMTEDGSEEGAADFKRMLEEMSR